MNALTVSEWVRHALFNRPLKESANMWNEAGSPEGAILASDLYHLPETEQVDDMLFASLVMSASPNIEATDYYMGFINDDELFSEAAIYYSRVGPDHHMWLVVISEKEDSEYEVRLFTSFFAASAFVTSNLLLGEKDPENPVAWTTMKSSITP